MDNLVQELFLAIEEEDFEEIERLIEVEKVDIDSIGYIEEDEITCSVLLCTVYWGNLYIVKYILDRGADMEQVSTVGETALLLAARKSSAEIIRELLLKGADVTKTDRNGKNFLKVSLGCRYYDDDIADMILSIARFDKDCDVKPAKK